MSFARFKSLFVRNGAIVGRSSKVFEFVGEADEMVESFIIAFYNHPNHLLPKELLVPERLDTKLLAQTLGIKVRVPKKGEKKELLGGVIHEDAQSLLDAHFKMLDYADKREE
ncbi:hypothetical protein [Listeria cornellensis]